jgi:hypothetical protein
VPVQRDLVVLLAAVIRLLNTLLKGKAAPSCPGQCARR